MASSEAADQLARRLRRYERTAARLDKQLRSGALTRSDVEALYEGLFIAAFVEFEKFLERVFHEIMLGKASFPSSRVVPRLDVRSPQVLDPLMRGTRRYVDWMPYNETEQR